MRQVRTIAPLFALLLCKAAFAAPLATQSRDVGAFHAIELDSKTPIAIDVRVGPAVHVEVHADSDVIARITTRVKDGSLVVGTRDSLHPENKTRVTITVPTLDALAVEGIGSIVATGITASSFAVAVEGTGSVKVGGASTGGAYKIEGTGQIDAKDLATQTASVAMDGTGHMALTASDAVTIAVDGTGAIDVFGHPKSITKSISGTAHISMR